MNFLIYLNTAKKRKMKTSLTKPKLIVCDIDGTLTRDNTIYPSEYTLDIIEKLHKQSIAFGLASGRGADQLVQLSEEWGLSFPFELVIGLNGSEYYDLSTHKTEVLYSLDREDIKDIITKMLDKYPDLNCSIYRNGQRLLRYEDEMAVLSKKRNKMNNYIVDDLSQMWDEPCSKVMFRVSEETMAKIEPLANEISNDRYRACKTQSTMMEFVHAKANKGNALTAYCTNNNIDLKDVVAFGDMDNDNELLITAGLGICMINGGQSTKDCADMLSEKTNNEDGCASFVEKYFLQ